MKLLLTRLERCLRLHHRLLPATQLLLLCRSRILSRLQLAPLRCIRLETEEEETEKGETEE